MSSYDLILRLIEMVLAEKEKNFQLRGEQKNDKDWVAYIVGSRNKLQFVPAFIFEYKKKVCVIAVTHTSYIYVSYDL